MVPPPGEILYERLRGQTAKMQAAAKKKSDPRLRAVSAREAAQAEREFAKTGEIKKKVIEEEKTISCARSMILGMCGNITPNDIVKEGSNLKDIAGKMVQALSTILIPAKLLQREIPQIISLRMREKMPGVLSELQAHNDAVDKLAEYIAYWQGIQRTEKLPGFWDFKMKKYNNLKIISVIDGFFAAESAFAQRLFEGLDYLYHHVIAPSLIKRQ